MKAQEQIHPVWLALDESTARLFQVVQPYFDTLAKLNAEEISNLMHSLQAALPAIDHDDFNRLCTLYGAQMVKFAGLGLVLGMAAERDMLELLERLNADFGMTDTPPNLSPTPAPASKVLH